jgi:4-hydroxybenzoyl-CoA reductase subunit beta
MLLPDHTLHRPVSLDESLALLASLTADDHSAAASLAEAGGRERVRVLAGGTDVIFNMRLRLFQPEHLVSVRRIPELARVEELPDGGLRIGAGCRLVDLADDPRIVQRYPAFKESLDAVASAHVRNMGTLGGNICLETRCWYTNNSEEWRRGRDGCFKTDCEQCHVIPSSHVCHAINNADTPPALIALDAELTIRSHTRERTVALADFYRPDGIEHLALQPDELVTHLTLPPCNDRTVFMKYTPRRGMDFAIGAVAARCSGTGNEASRVTLVLGSISSAPIVVDAPARILEQQGLGDDALDAALDTLRDELGEVTNLYGRATYKKQIARTLIRRAIRRIREEG